MANIAAPQLSTNTVFVLGFSKITLTLQSIENLKASATRGRIDRLNCRRVTNQDDFWWTSNVFLSIRDRWKAPPKSLASAASANDNEVSFLAGYINFLCLQNKRVLLDTFVVHLSREQQSSHRGTPVWHHELACRKSLRCVRLDYRSRLAEAVLVSGHFT